MAALTPYPELLCAIVEQSRRTVGFFPAHNPRALEYPWILASLQEDLRGLRILDVGAGINPLPFMLSNRGARVTTLDNHSLIRDPTTREQWNEWGYLDYALLDPRIASVQMAYEDFSPADRFDAIYSVSVIEHVPADVRRSWIENFVRQLTPNGLLLLTVDLVSGTDALWNMSEGQVVELQEIHGEFSTLQNELQQAGIVVGSTGVQREIPDSRVDVGFIKGWNRNEAST